MPYNDESGRWIYEHEHLSMGDPLRVAAYQLCRDIESYLFDLHHPGYAKTEFLSWALARFDATHVSSGTPVDNALYWDPDKAQSALPNAEKGDSYVPGARVDFGVHYLYPAFGTGHADGGEAELYGDDPKTVKVIDPGLARHIATKEGVVVSAESVKPNKAKAPKDHADAAKGDK